mmetsp:Transcript_16579/g.28750  ORF Transcript_16579/g.28750 Transcript_16579/m.28750 type:complete len:245 (-) Transcript_16579:30-764(-)
MFLVEPDRRPHEGLHQRLRDQLGVQKVVAAKCLQCLVAKIRAQLPQVPKARGRLRDLQEGSIPFTPMPVVLHTPGTVGLERLRLPLTEGLQRQRPTALETAPAPAPAPALGLAAPDGATVGVGVGVGARDVPAEGGVIESGDGEGGKDDDVIHDDEGVGSDSDSDPRRGPPRFELGAGAGSRPVASLPVRTGSDGPGTRGGAAAGPSGSGSGSEAEPGRRRRARSESERRRAATCLTRLYKAFI